VPARGKRSDRKERERKLDQAIEMTFPASDPIAVGSPTGTEGAGRADSRKGVADHRGGSSKSFAVGLKLGGRAQHVLVDAEDALIAALRIKTERPEALILYVRPANRRGDARHPPRTQSKAKRE
jgi:hypothetical protein